MWMETFLPLALLQWLLLKICCGVNGRLGCGGESDCSLAPAGHSFLPLYSPAVVEYGVRLLPAESEHVINEPNA